MNGRCQKDALDRAEDICELCGNQYCAHCLLFPRGHRNAPTCKTCALENSGIRGGSAKNTPISKREYKKRKKALLAQLDEVEENEPAIEYFELQDPSKFDRSTELDRRPTAVVPEEPKIDILNTDSDAASEAPISPAPQTPAPATQTPPPPAATPPPSTAAPAASEPAPQQLAPVDTSVNPLELDWSSRTSTPIPAEAPASEATTSAADLLARLKADQPIQSQFSTAPAELDIDPFAAPAPASAEPAPAAVPAAMAPPAPLAPAQADASPSRPSISEEWAPPAPPPRGTNLAAKLAETSHGSSAPRSGASFAPAPVQDTPPEASPFQDAPLEAAPFQDAPLEAAPFQDTPPQQAPAPKTLHIAPIQDAAFIDTPFQSAPTAPESFASEPVAPAPLASEPFVDGPFASERPSKSALPIERRAVDDDDAFNDDHPGRRQADTDDSGQWIPPSLRGISTPAERGPLPKRRS